jgi:hypothetical protein
MSLEQQLLDIIAEAKLATDRVIEDAIKYYPNIYGRALMVADRNRHYYDKKIALFHQRIEHENMPKCIQKDELAAIIKHKQSAFRITKDFEATDIEIQYFVFTDKMLHVVCPIQTNEFYHCKKVKGYIVQIKHCLEVKNDIRLYKLFQSLLALFDLKKSTAIDNCIAAIYSLIKNVTHIGPIQEFIGLYITVYAIPEYTEKVRVLKKGTPLCEDTICEILSFVNDGLLTRYEVDTMVYSTF